MKYRKLIGLSLFLMLAACSNGNGSEQAKETSGDSQEQVVEKTKEDSNIEFPEAASNPEQIVTQTKGIKADEAGSLMEGDKYDSEAWEELLQDFKKGDFESADLYNGLIHTFGSDYQESYEALGNFEPDYGEYDVIANQETVKNIAIHLDSSGSMAAYVPGGIKMDLAKDAIKKYASGLPNDSMISLRVYGHKGTGSDQDKDLSCGSTEIMYAVNTYQDEPFSSALTQFKPSGWTPLASTIKSAYDDLKMKASDHSENILFIVSDGIETCGGNPVEEARNLANSDLHVKVNIIGFNVDDKGQKQLKETAAAGNGTYYTVNSNIELNNTISDLLAEAQSSIQKNFEKGKLGYQANMHSVKVGDQIKALSRNFKDAIYEEYKLLHEAAYQLQTLEYITQEEGQALTSLIEERYDVMNELKDELQSVANGKSKAKLKEIHEGISAS
ncbi:VWA domain-containing protein [Niallia sp. Krafla_26]|uniref:VWA domain-containing protein n=1 Tax=Niallia sp. Krafla_26 TaxID=3064703 RepID=UPI003D162AA1